MNDDDLWTFNGLDARTGQYLLELPETALVDVIDHLVRVEGIQEIVRLHDNLGQTIQSLPRSSFVSGGISSR